MRVAILGFATGVCCLQTRASLWSNFVLCLVLGVALLLALWLRKWSLGKGKIAGLFLVGALGGFAWAGLFAQAYLAQALPTELEDKNLTIIGTIATLPNRFEHGVGFHFDVEKVLTPTVARSALPDRLALAWYAGYQKRNASAMPEVRPGERWQLTVRLRRPHGNANPYGFDYEAWLLGQKLRATGSVHSDSSLSDKNQRLAEFVPGVGNWIERQRYELRQRLQSTLSQQRYGNVIVALVIGDQRGIGQDDWDVFHRTGIGHLMSISGLHITMIAGLVAALFMALWRRSLFTKAQLPLLLPVQKAGALVGALAALGYVLLAGFGIPAQRTLYMLSIVAVALWSGRLAKGSHVLCVALGLVLVLDPWAVLWPGFWLSFGAVGLILYAAADSGSGAGRTGPAWREGLRLAVRTQYAITLGLVPLTMLLFGQVSLVGPLANALAIPLVGFFVTPLALLGSVLPAPLSDWLLLLAHQLVAWLAVFLEWLSSWQGAVWQAPRPSWGLFSLALLGGFWLLAPRGWPARWLGLVLCLPLFLSAPARPEKGELWMTAFDVGQGTAVLIETAQHRLLYDTGPAYSQQSDAAGRVLLPYLKGRGIRVLDAVVISHHDNDHSGGALTLFSNIQVAQTLSSLPLDSSLAQAAPNHRRCMDGQRWVWDGAVFEILQPAPVSYTSSKWKSNDRSCTLKVTMGEHAVLLPGDIGRVQEIELLESAPQRLPATVLLAPHHGSGTSSTSDFLAEVAPSLAIFQVGHRNRYRHPQAEVYARYGEMGIARLRTDQAGAVVLRFRQGVPVFEQSSYRHHYARYWQGR